MSDITTILLWEDREHPVEITVDPADMTLTAWDEAKIKQMREDYRNVKVYAVDYLSREYQRRWKEAKIVEISDFTGSLDIVNKDEVLIAHFSGSDEYGGFVRNVWRITEKKDLEEDKTFQLWVS